MVPNNFKKEEAHSNNGLYTPIYLVSFSFGIISFLLPIYSKRIGANTLEIGLLFSVFSFIALIIRPIVGWALDRYGRKNFFILSLILYTFSMAIFSISTSIKWLYVARVLQGIGSSVLWTTTYTLTADLFDKKDKGKSMGAVNEVSARGSLIGAIFGFIVLSKMPLLSGWKMIFYCYAVMAAIGAVIAWKRVPATKSIKEVSEHKIAFNKYFFKIISIIILSSMGSSILDPILIIYLQEKFTADIGLLAIASVPAAIIISTLPSKMGGLSDRFGRTKPLTIGLLICGISSILIVKASSIYMLVVFWAIEAVGTALVLPAERAIISDMTDENHKGTGYGIYTFAAGIGSVVGPILGGALYKCFSNTLPFIVCGIILILSSVLTFIMFKGKGRS